jgi:hypothetical protein
MMATIAAYARGVLVTFALAGAALVLLVLVLLGVLVAWKYCTGNLGDCIDGVCKGEVLDRAASYLCPNNPQLVRGDLGAQKSSTALYWAVWIGDRDDDLWFDFDHTAGPDGEFDVPLTVVEYRDSLPESC